jgi:hypothetical protein
MDVRLAGAAAVPQNASAEPFIALHVAPRYRRDAYRALKRIPVVLNPFRFRTVAGSVPAAFSRRGNGCEEVTCFLIG